MVSVLRPVALAILSVGLWIVPPTAQARGPRTWYDTGRPHHHRCFAGRDGLDILMADIERRKSRAERRQDAEIADNLGCEAIGGSSRSRSNGAR